MPPFLTVLRGKRNKIAPQGENMCISGAFIDSLQFLWYSPLVKGIDEDNNGFARCAERDLNGGRILHPCFLFTPSEPTAGNSRPGAPVTVPMSGGLVRNQGGTVEYHII